MVNIYSYVEDLECTEHFDKAEELKELLKDEFEEFCSSQNIDYTWLSDSHIQVEDEEDEESIEDDIKIALTCVYDSFMERIEEELEEDVEEDY